MLKRSEKKAKRRRRRRRRRMHLQQQAAISAAAGVSSHPRSYLGTPDLYTTGSESQMLMDGDDLEPDDKKLIGFLTRTQYVRSIEMSTYSKLVPLMKPLSVSKGEVLFDIGTPLSQGIGSGLFIVRSGRLGTFTNASEYPVNEVGPGESLGEFGLIGSFTDTDVHELRIVGLEDTEMYQLSQTAFVQFVGLYPKEMMLFLRTSIARQWRVASYVLDYFLGIPLSCREAMQGCASVAFVKFAAPGMQTLTPGRAPLRNEHHLNPHHPLASLATISSDRKAAVIPNEVHELAMPLTLHPGEVLFEVGDKATHVYIVETGKLVAEAESGEVTATLMPGFVVGGISFFGGTDRGERIVAAESCQLMQFSKELFDTLVEQAPQHALAISQTVGRQLSPVLHDFFRHGLQTAWFHSGETIYKEGDPSDALYIIISGRVRVISRTLGRQGSIGQSALPHQLWGGDIIFDDVNPYEASEYGRGDTLGETVMLAGEDRDDMPIRKATAVCVRDTRIVKLSHGAFAHVVGKYPMIMMRFAKLIARRLMHDSEPNGIGNSAPERRQNISTIALIPVGGGHTPHSMSACALRLVASLQRIGATLHLSTDRYDQHMQNSGAHEKLDRLFFAEQASQWITEQEEEHQFIVFEAQPGGDVTPWNRCCMRHADCILLVGRATSDSHIFPAERELVWRRCGPHSLDDASDSDSHSSDSESDTDDFGNDVWDGDYTPPQRINSHDDSVDASSAVRQPKSRNVSTPLSQSTAERERWLSTVTHGRKIQLMLLHNDSYDGYRPTNTKTWLKCKLR
jgi:CRP-like cAMP-binding protein